MSDQRNGPSELSRDLLRARMRRVEVGAGCRQFRVNVDYRRFIMGSKPHHELGLCSQACSLLAV